MVDDMAAPDFKGLGLAVRRRREALGLSLNAVRERGGPAVATLQKIEAGQAADYRPTTIRPLELALAWAPGSVQALLDHDEPTEMMDGALSADAGRVRRDSLAARDDAVAQLVLVRSLVDSHLRAIVRVADTVEDALRDHKPDVAAGLLDSIRIICNLLADATDPSNPELARRRTELVADYRHTWGRGAPAYDPDIHEPMAADSTREPTSAELQEQHEAKAEEAAAAEERRRQDESSA